MALWFRRAYGWARKGAETIATALGYGSGKYGDDPYGQ